MQNHPLAERVPQDRIRLQILSGGTISTSGFCPGGQFWGGGGGQNPL